MNEFEQLQQEVRQLRQQINQDEFQSSKVIRKKYDFQNRLVIPTGTSLPDNPQQGEIFILQGVGLYECKTTGTWQRTDRRTSSN